MVGPNPTIKFLCSYGGKILPRYPDGKLRYHGGETRVLAVHRSISFSELTQRMEEMCGTSAVSLRCQLPTEDLDALVSITSDEDLANLIEEYDGVASLAVPSSSLKIRAFLSLPKSTTTKNPISPDPPSSSTPSSKSSTSSIPRSSFIRQISATPPPVAFPLCSRKSAGKSVVCYGYHVHQRNRSHIYLIRNGSHWQ